MAVLLSVSLAATDERCKVTDATGTPLNVRASPNGKVIDKVANGKLVSNLAYEDDDNGKTWAQVEDHQTKKLIGWVFREFISCY